MKKWIFIIILVFVGFFGIIINVYLNAMKPLRTAEEKAFNIAKEEASLVTMTDFELYNGDQTYYVVNGVDSAGDEVIVWIPEKKGKVIIKETNSGITKQQAIEKLNESITSVEIVAVRLGIVKNKPAWEIYYRSNGDLINYYYVDFETGDWLRRIENL